jgi:hypothetical protein
MFHRRNFGRPILIEIGTTRPRLHRPTTAAKLNAAIGKLTKVAARVLQKLPDRKANARHRYVALFKGISKKGTAQRAVIYLKGEVGPEFFWVSELIIADRVAMH